MVSSACSITLIFFTICCFLDIFFIYNNNINYYIKIYSQYDKLPGTIGKRIVFFVVPAAHTHLSFIKILPPDGHEDTVGIVDGIVDAIADGNVGDIAGVRAGVIVGVKCSIIWALLNIFLYIIKY
jgi:hypothetical protein